MRRIAKLVAGMAAVCAVLVLCACGGSGSGGSASAAPNARTASFDEMVAYLTEQGFIAEDAAPININVTDGYLTDNTGGEFPDTAVADRAEDLGGLWLFWWDLDNPTDMYEVYTDMQVNEVILLGGGAKVLEPAATNGAFAIAFAPDYAQADEARAAFLALPSE